MALDSSRPEVLPPLQRLAHFCHRRRRAVLGAWVLVLVGFVALNSATGGKFLDKFDIPGSESREALDALRSHGFTSRSGFSGLLVFRAANVRDPAVRESMERLFDDMEDVIAPGEIISPYSDASAGQINADGTIAYAEVNLADRDSDQYTKVGGEARGLVERSHVPGTQIELGGDIFRERAAFSSEAIGLLAAIVVLLIAFGSVLAMGLPIITAIFGVVTGVAIVGLSANVVTMPSFSNQAVAMIGIGVGIDYALLIVTRYREGLHADLHPEAAATRAIDTAGRAVLLAGCTVIIAMLGLFVIGLAYLRGLAVGVSIGVLTTMIASVTLLPAVLGFVGRNIDKLGLPHRARASGAERHSVWYRWSRVIQRRPWPALVAGALLLVVLTVPVFAVRLGNGDAGNRPTSDTTRRAYDLIDEGFGPGANGPLLLVAQTPGGPSDVRALDALSDTLNRTAGVEFASPPIPGERGNAAIIRVQPTTSPQDKATQDLVHRLRAHVVPVAVAGTDLTVKVGGATAAVIDFSEYTGARLPWFIATVLVLSFLLLTVVFRSLLVPLKAVIMNLLTVGATYGVLVAVFQWGWGADLIGVGKRGPIDAWAPVMLFAIIFGLSMDYEVFLLSRIREAYDRTHDNATAVADGLASTARVITAAAAIMFCVFAAFVFGDQRALKMMGLGLATAVLLDATVVRLALVPATMALLGDRNWWLPAWLQRILPRLDVDGAAAPAVPAASDDRGPAPEHAPLAPLRPAGARSVAATPPRRRSAPRESARD
jgi:putative drug exporter of the RND superfamily